MSHSTQLRKIKSTNPPAQPLMVSSSPRVMESSFSQISMSPTRLPFTPSRSHHTFESQAMTSSTAISQNAGSSATPRACAANFHLNGDQGPITMQTRIAVRDATPHRFQIIPLREAKSRHNLSEARVVNLKGLELRSRVSQHLADWQPPTTPTPMRPRSYTNVSRPRNNYDLISTTSSMVPPCDKDLSLQVHEVKSKEKTAHTRGFQELEKPVLPDISTPNRPQQVQATWQPKPGDLSHTSTVDSTSGVIKPQNKSSSKEPTRRITNDYRTCHVVLNKKKARAWSEDLTCGQCKAARNCVYKRLRPSGTRDDSWCATRRHAIYSDTLVLPMPDLIEPRRILLVPTPRNSPEILGHTCHQRTAFCCPEDVFGAQLNASSSRIVPSSRSEKNIPFRRSSADFPLTPSVPHLRLSRKSRDTLAIRVNVTSTLDLVHERPLRHSVIIIDLLFQLDQAIEEWDDHGRDCS